MILPLYLNLNPMELESTALPPQQLPLRMSFIFDASEIMKKF